MKNMKKIAVVLLAGILAASVAVMAGCQKNDSTSSKAESSAASKADDKKDESKTESKDESKTESKADESKAESSTEASTEESTEASAEGGETADASVVVGDWVAGTIVNLETKENYTPDEYAAATGAESAMIITLSVDAEGNALFSVNGQAKTGAYTFDGTNLVVTEANGEVTKFEYNAENNALGYEDKDSGVGFIFMKNAAAEASTEASTEAGAEEGAGEEAGTEEGAGEEAGAEGAGEEAAE